MLYQSEAGDFALALAGDAMVSRRLSTYDEPDYLRLVDLIRGCDAAFCNLEMPIHDYNQAPNLAEGTHMASDPRAGQELRWMGINLVSTANNHIYDYGEGGVLATQRKLTEAGIVYAGTGRNLSEARAPGYLETRNGRVALLAAASYFPPWGKAGEQRRDFQGRTGLSFLRHHTVHTVDSRAFEELQRVSASLGLEEIKARRSSFFSSADKYNRFESGSSRKELYLEPSIGLQLRDFPEVRFAAGDRFSCSTGVHPPDAEDILRWVRDARRQADWVVFSLHTHEGAFPVAGDSRAVTTTGLRDIPAEFVSAFSHACIEAGADVFVAHGPHLLRGIEIYRGKPVFYCLSEFVFQIETIRWVPVEDYERYGLGHEATPADYFDARSGGDKANFSGDPSFWGSVVAVCRFQGGKLEQIELHPIDLGHGRPRMQRGRPLLARGPSAGRVIKHLRGLSRPYGARITRDHGTWVVRP
ncbi:MAG: CapA family protein [Chloroflexi bacterium]|nr:CapA family protein [Chloroflexota bacterium]